MVRYHFHILGDDRRIEDLEGKDLCDLEEVREEAIAGAREIMSARILGGTRSAHWKFELENNVGETILKMSFADAIDQPPVEHALAASDR